MVGCGGPQNQTKALRSYLAAFVRALGYESLDGANLRAQQIPSLTPRVVLARDRCLLAGDAGGFVEPFSGEGISYAIRTGQLAASAIVAATADGRSAEAVYLELTRGIVEEILKMRKLKEFFALVPQHVHALYRRNDRVWSEFTGALRGTRPATVVRDNAPFALLWPLVDQVTAFAYQRKLKRRVELRDADFLKLVKDAPTHPAYRC